MTSTPASSTPLAVVMPTRNQAAWLEAAVESLFGQGVTGLRLFVQDGASDDGTQALLDTLARRHPGLHWASAPDTGPADALNRAFARALAETDAPVLGWLNSDDLVAAGALRRALDHLAAHPQQVAVYGQAEHIDDQGRVLGRYPTQRPDRPLATWRDACPVCQPTMVLRREALASLLPLDDTLQTAFDFELWLRLFKAWPDRIGFIDAVQAGSRLHAQAITLRLRESVAMEALRVVHRHLGPAPAHWLVTLVGEALAACPFEAASADVQRHLLALADEAAPWLEGGAEAARQQMRQCRAWQLLRPELAAGVHADGWAGPELEIRLRQRDAPADAVGMLRLHGRHAWPRPGRLWLQLSAWHEGRPVASTRAWWRRRFVLDIPVAVRTPGAPLVFRVRCSHDFVPAQVLAGSSDTRRLAFVVEAIDTLPGR